MRSPLPFRKLAGYALGAAILISAGPATVADHGRVLVERSAKKRPGWIVRLPPSEQYLYSVGFATGSASLEDGRSAAALDAVEDVVFYLGLRASARYEQRRTHLTTEILELIETSASAEIKSGRTAELYFERFRNPGGEEPRDVYDVFVLFRVPLSELEAERSRILAERSQAKRRAAALVAETSVETLVGDFIGGLSRLAGARRELERAAPGSSTLSSIDALFDEIAVRTQLALKSVEPDSSDGRLREITASAVLVGESGSFPLRGVPLEFEVAQGAERVTATAVTGAGGTATASIGFPLDPFRRALVQVRLHPSLLEWNYYESERRAPDEGLARLDAVEAYRVVHLVSDGSAAVPPMAEVFLDENPQTDAPAGEGAQPSSRGRVSITPGSETPWPGRRAAVLLPVLVRMAASPPPVDAPPPLNLALVLDCSDSMQESGRLDDLREAASLVVRSLGSEDVLSIVTYGDLPRVLLPAQGIEARRTVLYELSRLGPCGRSNLGGGIERAAEEIAPHVRPGSVSRMLVLTDGRANEGTTDAAGLVRLAGRVRERKISLGVVGLGNEMDRDLLSAIAEAGGGRFSRAASSTSLPGILSREIGDALARHTTEVAIELNLGPAASLVRAYGYPVHLSENSVEVLAGGVPAGESRSILLDLEVDCGDPRVKSVGSLTVKYRDGGRSSSSARVSRILSASCAPGRMTAPAVGEVRYVDLFARLGRAADTLEFVLYNWDPRLLEEMDAFLASEQPRIRREVDALDDPELADLVRFIDRGAVDMWEGVSRMAEAIERHDPKLFPDYRLFRLRHWDTQSKRDRN